MLVLQTVSKEPQLSRKKKRSTKEWLFKLKKSKRSFTNTLKSKLWLLTKPHQRSLKLTMTMIKPCLSRLLFRWSWWPLLPIALNSSLTSLMQVDFKKLKREPWESRTWTIKSFLNARVTLLIWVLQWSKMITTLSTEIVSVLHSTLAWKVDLMSSTMLPNMIQAMTSLCLESEIRPKVVSNPWRKRWT